MSHFTESELQTIAKHFVVAAIWADAPEGTNPRATKDSLQNAYAVCRDAIAQDPELFRRIADNDAYGWSNDSHKREPLSHIGHDLYMTGRGHGAGFWDRGLEDDGDAASEIARNHALTEPTFYRGWIHF